MAHDDLLSSIVNDAQDKADSAGVLDSAEAGAELAALLDQDLTVGELLTMNYRDAQVLVHDHSRHKVRGLPHGSFLVASRMELDVAVEKLAEDEETCLILLRIIDECPLPNAREMEDYRFQAGMRATDSGENWDHPNRVDEWTRNNLSYGGYKCRVLGTFRMKQAEADTYVFCFGGDLLNYYSGRGMKVYKPVGRLLSEIVNFQKNADTGGLGEMGRLRVGRVRFAASEIGVDEGLDNVPVEVNPADFVSRRTFYGGMSRGGKSNAMKIAAKAVYLLRTHEDGPRVGQLIFDPNGEYANENVQDRGSITSIFEQVDGVEREDEIATYGLNKHPNDPKRKIVKINFFGNTVTDWKDRDAVERALEQLIVGKSIIDGVLSVSDSIYIGAFRNTVIEVPASLESPGDRIRFRRLIGVYRSTLHAAGLRSSQKGPRIKGLFGQALRDAMGQNKCDGTVQSDISAAADVLGKENPTWDEFVEACRGLQKFMDEKNSGYSDFERKYRESRNGRAWADDALKNVLKIYQHQGGITQLRGVAKQHSSRTTKNFATEVVEDLRAGKLVIFDQSTGDPEQNVGAAERILWEIFNFQKRAFVDPKLDDQGQLVPPSPVMVYLEEAHNLLPAAGGKDELKTIWARTAKEGSKYRIGMVLATQEPSSVMPAILKNTDNWFVAHLNNADEIRALSKFYDFEDYSHQIKSISDPGFVRMRTLSNPFTIPVQIDLFTVDGGA